jgi:xanthine/uracil/vitamin C permease (AzgA family)
MKRSNDMLNKTIEFFGKIYSRLSFNAGCCFTLITVTVFNAIMTGAYPTPLKYAMWIYIGINLTLAAILGWSLWVNRKSQ